MPIKDFTGAQFDDYGVTVPLYPNVTDDIDVMQLPSSMRGGSDLLDTLIQLDLVKNTMENDFSICVASQLVKYSTVS